VPEERVNDPDPVLSFSAVVTFWLDLNSRRWQHALGVEATQGRAVCDGDPLKLHYDYGLLRLGLLTQPRYQAHVAATRAAIAQQRLGMADVVLCSIPDQATLEGQMRGDAGRRRHRFSLHRELAGPLQDWYLALDATDPGRVIWGFRDAMPGPVSRPRYDLALFDSWMARLPI
jgi:hypothetical protein